MKTIKLDNLTFPQIKSRVIVQVSDQVIIPIWEQTFDQINDKIRNQIRNQIENQVFRQICRQIYFQTYNIINKTIKGNFNDL